MHRMASKWTAGASDVSYITCRCHISTIFSPLTSVSARLAGIKPFEAKLGGIKYNLQLEPLRGKASKAGTYSHNS